MHPAPTTASNTRHMQQDWVTGIRAVHWQRRLCTAAESAARVSVAPRPCRALHVVSERSREPRGCPTIEASTTAELRLLPAARTRDERSAQPHASWRCTRAACAPDGCQEVSSASTVDSPAAQRCGTMSALAAHAVDAAYGGSSSM